MKTANVVFAIAFALGLASTVAANASLVTAPQVLTSKLIWGVGRGGPLPDAGPLYPTSPAGKPAGLLLASHWPLARLIRMVASAPS